MKLIAYITMTICLVMGTLSAVTAYAPSLDRPDADLVGLTVNVPAGAVEVMPPPVQVATEIEEAAAAVDDGADEFSMDQKVPINVEGEAAAAEAAAEVEVEPVIEPLVDKGEVITAEMLTMLRDADVKRVRVKEFSIARWDHWWVMLLSALGLTAAAMIVRNETRKEIAEKMTSASDAGESPEQALKDIARSIEQLISDLNGVSLERDRLAMIIDRLGGMQRGPVQIVIDARSTLIARLSLTGYAQFMDRFSALERQINRAWSAAADDVYKESMECLRNAHDLVPDVLALTKKS